MCIQSTTNTMVVMYIRKAKKTFLGTKLVGKELFVWADDMVRVRWTYF